MMDDWQGGGRELPAEGAGSEPSLPKHAPRTAQPISPDETRRMLERMAIVTDILRGWIWETDAQHRFTYMSDSVARYAGRPPEWHYGRTRQQLGNLNPDDEKHRRFLAQLDAQEMFGPIDFVRYQNGTQLWMRTIGLPRFDAEGRFTGYCGVAFDITAEVESRQGNRRMEPRRRIARSATIVDHTAPATVPCVVLDISKSGARLDVHQAALLPSRFRLNVELDGSERVCEVVWRRENSVGVRFVEPAGP